MAEMISGVDFTAAAPKAGRHSRFTGPQDLVIAREVAAARAHTPNYGETKKRFTAAADKVNEKPLFKDPITWKTVQDRYKRLQDQYNGMDDANQRLSGVGGGEMGELADLLMGMREARDDWEAGKSAVKAAEKKKEDDKVRIGEALVARATTRQNNSGDDNDLVANGSSDDKEDVPSGSARKKRKTPDGIGIIGMEMEQFGGHLKESDLARIALERDKFMFDKEKDAADRSERQQYRAQEREEREEERRERREERMEQQKLELEKFKAMLDVLSKKQ